MKRTPPRGDVLTIGFWYVHIYGVELVQVGVVPYVIHGQSPDPVGASRAQVQCGDGGQQRPLYQLPPVIYKTSAIASVCLSNIVLMQA